MKTVSTSPAWQPSVRTRSLAGVLALLTTLSTASALLLASCERSASSAELSMREGSHRPLAARLAAGDPARPSGESRARLQDPVKTPGAAPRGDARDESRRDFDTDCLRSGCHASLKEPAWVHAPVGVGSCSACHVQKGRVEDHLFDPARPEDSACSFCHRPAAPQPVVHQAFADGDCTGCHDPHGGKDRYFLLGDDDGGLCASRCHDPTRHAPVLGAPGAPEAPGAPGAPGAKGDAAVAWQVLHQPVAEKKCRVCHEPHQSAHAALLVRPGNDLCTGCHDAVAERVRGGARVHDPVGKDCLSCHAAHGSDHPKLLVEEGRAQCLRCHEDVAKKLGDGAQHVHGALETDKGCRECHDPHAAKGPALLAGSIAENCYGCHGREIVLASGRRIEDVKKAVAEAKHVHEPVATGECQRCHDPHASPFGELLVARLVTEPYAAYSDDAYALCFSCHDKALVTEPVTTDKTRFRDGDRNLHHLHVNQKVGRTCGLCHEAHASSQEALVPTQIPFGDQGYLLPVEFHGTPTGGSCGAGCHKAATYDRGPEPEPEPAERRKDGGTPIDRGGGEDRRK